MKFMLAKSYGFNIPRGPLTIASFVVLTGGLEGFYQKKHQPLPGMKKFWEGLLKLNTSVYAIRALRKRENENDKLNFGDGERVDYDLGDDD